MSNVLVAVFSATGTTQRAAKTLADVTGADYYEIKPAQPYTQEDLAWTDPASRSSVEMKDKSIRPELADHDAPVDGHDTILLGFPIWWHTAPGAIRSFLDAYDFGGKRIVLFATSGGSDLGPAASELGDIAPGADIENGRIVNWPHNSPKALRGWTDSIGVTVPEA